MLILNFPSVLMLNEVYALVKQVKSFTKITMPLDSQIFENITFLALKTFCFVYTISHLVIL